MKLTKRQLKRLIKEDLDGALYETGDQDREAEIRHQIGIVVAALQSVLEANPHPTRPGRKGTTVYDIQQNIIQVGAPEAIEKLMEFLELHPSEW